MAKKRAKRILFGSVLAVLLLGLAAMATIDWTGLRYDKAVTDLVRLRQAREQRVRDAVDAYQASLENEDAQKQSEASGKVMVELRNARLARGGGFGEVIATLTSLGEPAADRMFARLQDPHDEWWLTFYDAIATGLAQRPGPGGDLFARRLEAFERDALSTQNWQGRNGMLRTRLAVLRHRGSDAPESQRQDLGLPEMAAVGRIIDLLESPSLFDRLSAAGALENIFCRPVRKAELDDRAAWQAEAQRWREWWQVHDQQTWTELLCAAATDEELSAQWRAGACERLRESRRREEAIAGLIEATRVATMQTFDLEAGRQTEEAAVRAGEAMVKARAAGSMAQLGLPAAIRRLLDFLYQSPRLGTNMPIPALEELDRLGDTAGPFVMAELYAARARVAGSEGSQEASYVRELEGFLARHPVDSDRARQHFHQLARSQDSTERFIALQALTGLADSYPDALQDPSDPTLEIYSMAIGDADPTIRIEAARGLLRYDRDRANIGIVSVVAPNLIPLLGHADDKIALPAHSLLQDALKFRSSFRGRQRPQTTAADVQHDRYEVQLQWGKFWFGKDYKLPQPAEDAEAPEPAE